MARPRTRPEACRKCGKTPYKHAGRGLCWRCYWAEPDVRAKRIDYNRKRWAGLPKEEKQKAKARIRERHKVRMKSDPDYRARVLAERRKRYHSDEEYRKRVIARVARGVARRNGTDTGLPIPVRSGAVFDDLVRPYLDEWAKLPSEESVPPLPPKEFARKTSKRGRPPSWPKKDA